MSEQQQQPEAVVSEQEYNTNLQKILKQRHVKAVLEHLIGPTGSIIFHIILVFCLIKFVVMDTNQKPADITVKIMEPDTADLEKFEKELEKLEELKDITDVATPSDVMMDTPVDAPPAPSDAVAPGGGDTGTDLAALNVLNDMSGPLVMKGLYAGRSAGGRASSLRAYGGSGATESAVLKALEWLKAHQAADGSWGPNKVGMTGMGLLTFLAHGETTASEKYGQVVEKAIRFLVSTQKEDGSFGGIAAAGKDGGGDASCYAHGIATYAICEAYGLTRIPTLKDVMEKAVSVVLNGQQAGGGWDYRYSKGARRDTSVCGWQIQALKSAFIAGSENPKIHDALERAATDLKSVQNEAGLFGYTDRGGGKVSCTGIAVLCLKLIGHSKDREVDKGMEALRTLDCDFRQPINWAYYTWYYVTQAKFHQGGSTWQSWNQKFAREYVKNQADDGHWDPLENEEKSPGLVYTTALAALTLQVYYRFLPTYKPIAVEAPADEKDSDDIKVNVSAQ